MPWNWLTMRVSAKKVLWLLTFFRWCVCDMSLKLLDHTKRYYCANSSEKLQQSFIITGMRSYLLKDQLQMQSTETSFCICLWSITKCCPNFITCLYFLLTLIRWNRTHCHLIYPMKLFKSKESLFKQWLKNCMSKNDFRVTSIFKIIIRICKKNVEFCGKTSKSLPKRCLFIFCIFYLNWNKVCLIKYVENKIFNSISHKKKERKKRERDGGAKT